MNSVLLVASLLLNASVMSDAIKCYHCLEESWKECQENQKKRPCSDPFPLGNSHCYSVSGKYDNGTAVLDLVAKGCVDCKDKKKACEVFKLVLATVTRKPLTCNMACCKEDLCNTLSPTPTTTKQRSIRTMPLYSGARRIHLQAVYFISIATVLLYWEYRF